MSKHNNEIQIEELEKALSMLFNTEEVDEILKAKDTEEEGDDDDIVQDPETDQDEDEDGVEKAYNKMKAEVQSMEKAYKSKLAELNKIKPAQKVKKSEDEDIEKSEKADLIKSIMERFEESDELRKSVEELSDSFDEIKEMVQSIANQPNGRRAVINQSQVLEKADSENDLGNKAVSINDRKMIEKGLESLMMKANEEGRLVYEDALLYLNSGGVMPEVSILKSIETDLGINFVK